MRCDHNDLSRGLQFADLARRGDTIEIAGHLEIHQDDIRLKLLNGGQRGCAGISFGNDLNIIERVQKGAYPLTYDLVVIHEKNFDWHRVSLATETRRTQR